MSLAALKQLDDSQGEAMAKNINKLPAIALSADLKTRTTILEFFKAEGWSEEGVINADQIQAVELLAQSTTPPIVMIDVQDISDPIAYLEQLSNVCDADSKVLVIGNDNRIQTYHAIKALGVMDYLPKPLSVSDLTESFQADNHVVEATDKDENKKALTIAVIGARGGVGATSLALEIARTALPEQKSKKASSKIKNERHTVLLDLDVHFGCTALYTDIQPTHALVEALASPERIDDLFLERSSVTLDDGLQLLAAEDDPSHMIDLGEEALDILLSRVCAAFKTVVVDCPRNLLPQVTSVSSHFDHLVVVLEPNIASLRDAIRISSWIDTLESKPTTHFIVNKQGQSKNAELSAKDITQTLGKEPIASLMFHLDSFSLAAEKGSSIQEGKAPKQIKLELTKIHDAIFGVDEAATKSSRLGKIWGRK